LEKKVLWLQCSLFDPELQGVTGSLRDFELHWALSLVLHNDSARRHLAPVAYVSHFEGDEVASPQLAIDAQVE